MRRREASSRPLLPKYTVLFYLLSLLSLVDAVRNVIKDPAALSSSGPASVLLESGGGCPTSCPLQPHKPTSGGPGARRVRFTGTDQVSAASTVDVRTECKDRTSFELCDTESGTFFFIECRNPNRAVRKEFYKNDDATVAKDICDNLLPILGFCADRVIENLDKMGGACQSESANAAQMIKSAENAYIGTTWNAGWNDCSASDLSQNLNTLKCIEQYAYQLMECDRPSCPTE
uniref:Uncharacterized protein n=1 Tax=Chromera velia CCMP2878 TaxID=1169474 RepID=A0A0G4GNF6_9ALVE|eukprot:Cvel_22666.t1-p1 / transcript=Cvel_22666.t1 / gene=Cvel_22666 / organism=Chromera_velia_CCMP2878 / gene_product=hypothetical protein / transcript_product=hypothetical protein / location=Cvel_scaffold2252:23339-24031(+) / protein_length=231 / sequence_SO=supercontig / SO=protein_coding / is_pseudo=false